jgi:hypothetical protein
MRREEGEKKESGFDKWRRDHDLCSQPAANVKSQEAEDDKPDDLKTFLRTILRPADDEVLKDFHGWQERQYARDLQMPIESVAMAKRVFDSFDYDKSATLDFGELEAAVFTLLQLTTTGSVPIEDLKSVSDWGYWDCTDGKGISFYEFMKWYSSNSFKEDILLSRDQQELRRIAKKHRVTPDEVERVKKNFDTCTNNADEVSFVEFGPLMHSALQLPSEISESRIRFFWTQVDADGSGKVSFTEFFDWWMLYFKNKDSTGSAKESPYGEFYRQVRVIGKDHLDPPPYVKTSQADADEDYGPPEDVKRLMGAKGYEEKKMFKRLSQQLLGAFT